MNVYQKQSHPPLNDANPATINEFCQGAPSRKKQRWKDKHVKKVLRMRFGSGSSKKVSIIVKGILDICSVVLLHCLFLSLLNGNLPLRYIGLPKKQETKRLSCTTCPFLNISTRSFVEPILRGQIPYNTVPFHHLNGQQKVSPSCRW